MELIKAEEGEILDIELEEDFLARNRQLAQENQRLLDQHQILAVDIMGSVGSGKTSLIRGLISVLGKNYRIGVIAGDVTTSIDAERVAQEGVSVLQINTGKECHLDAHLVAKALEKMDLTSLSLLFIENVGNLICPAEFPLGAHRRLVIISVTEGPWMVIKHPYIFLEADGVAVNKIDLARLMEVSPELLRRDLQKIRPDLLVAFTNCLTGAGLSGVIKALRLPDTA